MAIIFRPTDVTAVKHAGYARKLGASMAGASTRHSVFDGYLFRAIKTGPNVVVTAIDIEALWVFLHWDVLPGTSSNYLSAMRHLRRGQLVPQDPLATTPKPRDDTLDRWLTNASAYLSFDTNALVIVNNMQSVPRITQEGVTATLQLATSGGDLFVTDRFQFVVSSLRGPAKFFEVGSPPPVGTAVLERYARDMFFTESALTTITSDSNAKLQPRQKTRYNYSVPTFGAQVSADCYASREEGSLDYNDVALGGAYVSQVNSSNTPIAPEDPDPARVGIAGVWLTRLRRWPLPFDADVQINPSSLVWSFSQLMSSNPETALRPTTYVVSGHNVITEHGVEGVAVAAQRVFDPPIDPDGAGAKGWVALFYTTRNAEGEMPSPVWRALQVTKITPMGGVTTVTARISVDDKQNMLGPETFMFGSEGIVATEFEVAAGVMDQATVQMLHVSDAGVVSTSDMHTVGWYPFTDYLLNDASGSLFGQVPRWAVSIGNDKIAVVARNTVAAPLDTTIEWHLVIVRASTGEFLETRGSLGVAVTVNPFVHLGVVTPEFVGPGDVVVDAVLTYSFGNGHKLSTNGGRDWSDLFTGTFGAGVYLGNQLHPMLLEQDL